MDTSDGTSWSILGNAYFMHFFAVSQNPRTLRQAMSAYRQAVRKIQKGTTKEKSSNKFYYRKKMRLPGDRQSSTTTKAS